MSNRDKVSYTTITINILADEQEVNGPNESALSDAAWELSEDIEKYLKLFLAKHKLREMFGIRVEYE